MKIAIAYIAVSQGPITQDYCARFVATFQEYPPGVDCDLIVICNGGALSLSSALIFSGLNARMFARSNNGWDIGGYIEAANGPCAGYDMMLCLGESNYFHRPGWLSRIQEVWQRFGPGMYGPFSSNAVRTHLNTTAFCCPPLLLRQYPERVITRASRYEFEHGEQALWRRTAKQGMPVKLVTWDGEWEPRHWRLPANILWRGNQSNCLMWCNHSDRYAQVDAKTKQTWMRSCDRPFK